MSESEFVDDVDAIDVDEENGNNFPGNGEEDAMAQWFRDQFGPIWTTF